MLAGVDVLTRMRAMPALARDAALVALVALGARLLALALTTGYVPMHDDASYTRVARSLLATGSYPVHRLPGGVLEVSTYRPPGWPGTLAGLWEVTGPSVFAARLLLVGVGIAGCLAVWHIGARLFDRRTALAAGLIAAVTPPLVLTGASLESETLFTTLVLAAVVAALHARSTPHHRRWLVAAGLLTGLAALTRTNGLALVPLIAWLACGGAPAWRPRVLRALAVGLVAVATVTPWTIRNAEVTHAFVPVSTEVGNTLAGTYNDVSLHAHAQWFEPKVTGAYHAIYRRLGPSAAADSALRSAVLRFVVRHPGYPLRVVVTNAERFTGLAGIGWSKLSLRTMSLPDDDLGGLLWAGLLLTSLLALTGLPGVLRARPPLALLAIPTLLYLSAAAVNGEQRMVVPVVPFLALAGGVAAATASRAAEASLGRLHPDSA
jgi:4-amino-4-deoxy-L-arabinose transferase-like glycosyltransferase